MQHARHCSKLLQPCFVLCNCTKVLITTAKYPRSHIAGPQSCLTEREHVLIFGNSMLLKSFCATWLRAQNDQTTCTSNFDSATKNCIPGACSLSTLTPLLRALCEGRHLIHGLFDAHN